ncbi:MAG: hypothetical protein ACRDTU_00870 [Micromonosporaceae bacterium]
MSTRGASGTSVLFAADFRHWDRGLACAMLKAAIVIGPPPRRQ